MTKRLLMLGTAVMTTLLALLVLWQFRVVVIYVLISLALSATVRLVVRSESRSSFATRLLRILLYVVSIGIFGLLIFLVGRLLVGDLQQLAKTISVQSTWVLPARLRRGVNSRHIENTVETRRIALIDRERSLADLDQRLHDLEKRIAELEKAMAVAKTNRENRTDEIIRIRTACEEREKRRLALAARTGELEEEERRLLAGRDDLAAQMREKRDWAEECSIAASEGEELLETKRRHLFSISETLSARRNEGQRLQTTIENLQHREQSSLKDHETLEQAIERGERAGPASDVFSVGAVFYEVISGRRAFEADSMHAVLYKVTDSDPVPLGELCPDLPPILEIVVAKALAKDAELRYRNGAEMRRPRPLPRRPRRERGRGERDRLAAPDLDHHPEGGGDPGPDGRHRRHGSAHAARRLDDTPRRSHPVGFADAATRRHRHVALVAPGQHDAAQAQSPSLW